MRFAPSAPRSNTSAELLGATDVVDSHCLTLGLGLDLDATAAWSAQQLIPVTAGRER